MINLRRKAERLARRFSRTGIAFLVYRYRYLAVFTVIGFLSILLEIFLFGRVMPQPWPWLVKAGCSFMLGLLFSFGLNFCLNFHVPRIHVLRTFQRFSLISLLSFSLNMTAIHVMRDQLTQYYGTARLLSSASLFLIAYALHRAYTFDLGARNFGIAIYASTAENVHRIFRRLGRNCDHVHVDLVDDTMARNSAPIDLSKLRIVRRLWRRTPVCLHLMSRLPRRWLAETWADVDWYLFHVDVEDDLMELLWQCRARGKKTGVVWHQNASPASLMPYLPHVDFVMVLGIADPGRSGQAVSEAAIELAATLDGLRSRYGYEVMFDGGVNLANLARIRAKFVVSASAVLQAARPIQVAHHLRTGAKYANDGYRRAG